MRTGKHATERISQANRLVDRLVQSGRISASQISTSGLRSPTGWYAGRFEVDHLEFIRLREWIDSAGAWASTVVASLLTA